MFDDHRKPRDQRCGDVPGGTAGASRVLPIRAGRSRRERSGGPIDGPAAAFPAPNPSRLPGVAARRGVPYPAVMDAPNA